MAENFARRINGYTVKDAEARKTATTAGQMANAAFDKAATAENKIAEAVTTANRAKNTADRAVTMASGAYNEAEGASRKAEEAKETAAAALQREGGTMLGNLDMGGNSIENARQVHVSEGVTLKEYTGFDVSVSATVEPGVVQFWCEKNQSEGIDENGSVVVRGVRTPAAAHDAVNKKYVDDLITALRQEFSNAAPQSLEPAEGVLF
jgi:hypothetical protein